MKIAEQIMKTMSEKETSTNAKVNTLRAAIEGRNKTIMGLEDKADKLRDKKAKLTDIDKRKPISDEIQKLVNSIKSMQDMNAEDRAKIKKMRGER